MPSAFAALAEPLFRRYSMVVLLSSSNIWAFWVAQTWLIVRLSEGEPVIVGITAGCQFLPIVLVGLAGGSLADRFAKHKVWAHLDLVLGGLALVSASLVYFDAARPWHVMLIALGAGSASALSQPSRQTLAPEIVPPGRLVAAMSITSSMVSAGRMVGPLVTAVTLAHLDLEILLAGLALSMVLSAAALLRAFRSGAVETTVSEGPRQGRSVFAFLAHRPDLSIILGMLVVVCAVGWNSQMMIALVAEGVFMVDVSHFAGLITLYGLGGALGALHMIGRTVPTLTELIGHVVALAGFGLLAGWAPSLTVFAITLVPLGFSAFQIAVAASVVFIAHSPIDLRGRVMGIFMIATNGSVAVGGPALGLLSRYAGPQGAYVWSSVIIGTGLVVVAGVVLSVGRLRNYPWLRLDP